MLRRAARTAGLLAALAVAAGVSAGPAAGQDARVRTIVEDAISDDVYVEQAPIVAPERLAALAGRIAATDQRWAFVVLDADPGNAKQLAQDVVTELRSVTGEHTTVVVLTPTSIGAESLTDDYRARLDGALTDALPLLNRNPVAGIASVFEALSGARLAEEPAGASDGGGGGGTAVAPVALAIAAVAAGAFVVVSVLRRR